MLDTSRTKEQNFINENPRLPNPRLPNLGGQVGGQAESSVENQIDLFLDLEEFLF